MKKIMMLLAVSLAGYTTQAQYNTTIDAAVKDMQPGQWMYYNRMSGDDMDSVQTKAGGFTIKINIPEGEGDSYMVRFGKKYAENSYMFFYLEKGTVKITGNGPMFKDAKLSGSQFILDYNAYNDFIKNAPALKGRKELYQKANDLYGKGDTTALAALQPELDRMDSSSNALTKQWILQHKTSPVSAYILSFNLGRLELDEKEKILNELSPVAKNNLPAKKIANSIRINNLTGIGKTALDFTQNDTLGKPVSLKDFRGKYVLVDFWASWCKPCRAENPNVVSAYNKYKDKNFTVLSVSLDQPTGKEKWINAIHQDNLAWTHVSDLKFWNNAVARMYDINSIPANLLLDPDGKIIAKDLHEGELDKKLGEVLQ